MFFDSNTLAAIGRDAVVEGQTVRVDADVNNVDPKADAYARAFAFLNATATANANIDWDSIAEARIEGLRSGAPVTKVVGLQGIDVHAAHTNNNSFSEQTRVPVAIIPVWLGDETNNTDFVTRVVADEGAELTVGPRIAGSPLRTRPGFNNLALLVDANESGNTLRTDKSGSSDYSSSSKIETITWDSDVVVKASEASPELVVDATGKVIRAINVTVNGDDTPLGNIYAPGTDIEVGDIFADGPGPELIFETPTGDITNVFTDPDDGDHFWGTFTFRSGFDEVRITNLSQSDLVINNIDMVHGVSEPRVHLVDEDGMLGIPAATDFLFDILTAVIPGLIDIKNLSSSDLYFQGTGLGVSMPGTFPGAAAIENPIGETRILNTGGDIITTGSPMIIRTNTLGDPFAEVAFKDFEFLAGWEFNGTATFASNGSAPDTIALTGGAGWLTDTGLAAGDLIKITDSASNNGVFQIAAISGTTLTLNNVQSVTAGSGVVVEITPFHGVEASAGNVGTATNKLHVDLVRSEGFDDYPTFNEYIFGDAGADLNLNVGVRLRIDIVGDPTIDIDHARADGTVRVELRAPRVDETIVGTVGVAVRVTLTNTTAAGPPLFHDQPYGNFFNPDDETGSAIGATTFPRGAFAWDGDTTIVDATYDFELIEAGGNIDVDAVNGSPAPGIPVITITGTTNILTGGGFIDIRTNGPITMSEIVAVDPSDPNDMRVGQIESTGDDVDLTAPGSILDADPSDPGGSTDPADVIGVNIDLDANDGTIGTTADFLETDLLDLVSGVAQTGVLTAEATESIYVTETAGDLRVNTVFAGEDVTLTTRSGSIIDANGNGDDNVRGQAINLKAVGGGIGTGPSAAERLQIDSSRNSPFVCDDLSCQDDYSGGHTNPSDLRSGTPDIGLELGTDDVALEADTLISVEETSGYLRLLLAHAFGGNVTLLVRETTAVDEDLYLIRDGQAEFTQGAPRAVAQGKVFAGAGNVALNVGDDIATHSNSEILARGSIDIRVDFLNLDDDIGANATIRGRLAADCTVTGAAQAQVCNPSTGPPTAAIITITGGTDRDIFQLGDATGLPTAGTPKTSPGDPGYIKFESKARVEGGGNLDTFRVFYLQSTDVTTSPSNVSGAGHSVTLDGQSGVDNYEIFTTGSSTAAGVARNYVINILDTGAPADGADTATIHALNDAASSDLFLARAITCIDTVAGDCVNAEPNVENPGFVAQLHGTADDFRFGHGAQNTLTQRINYDVDLDSLTIDLEKGDDNFFSDDTTVPFTVNGGAGEDNFQIGQLFGLHRSSPNVLAADEFPTLIATTRGWLSPGISVAMTINGGVGNDETLVYSNKAVLTVNGGDGSDLTTTQAFALTPSVGNMIITNGAGVAAPIIGSGAGGTLDEVGYNLNSTVFVNGDDDFDKTVLLGTEFADDLAVSFNGIHGVGRDVIHAGIEIVEVDGLEGDDELSTATTLAGVGTRLIGGLGSDTFTVEGDIVDDIIVGSGGAIFVAGTNDTSNLGGPVAIEGGVTGADRSLISGVMLPGELDALFLPIELPPFESRQIDLVGIYNTADAVDDAGVLTETALNGFGIAGDLDFGVAVVGNPFGESQIFAGGVTFGTITFAAGAFSTDPVKSTIEVLNVLLGSGNDDLDVQGSLQADLDAEITAPDLLVDRSVTPFNVGAVAGGVTLSDPDWTSLGFRVGQLVYVDQGNQDSNSTPLAAWRIVDITGTVMELQGAGIIGPLSRVFVAGRHGGLTTAHGGGGDDTIIVCNPLSAVPCGLVGGPDSPLVIYGDTSQDGSWYSGTAGVDGFEHGPKPFDQFAALGLPDANNEDDEWFLAQGDTFANPGNDMIDGRALFAGVACDMTTCDLPTVGFTAYGGQGDDTIYGSQTGDHLAGGSGNDEIHGGRGIDHIYGDSGFNVNVFIRGLDVVSVDASGATNADDLTVGDDDLFGEGMGAVLGGPADVYDDFIAGDHGVFSQDTEDPNTPLPLLQKIQTTLRVTQAITAVFTEGGNDTIIDDLGADTVLGGLGNDRIETGVDDDIVIGDNGIVVFDLVGPRRTRRGQCGQLAGIDSRWRRRDPARRRRRCRDCR